MNKTKIKTQIRRTLNLLAPPAILPAGAVADPLLNFKQDRGGAEGQADFNWLDLKETLPTIHPERHAPPF
jgi:hypothetical protein